jgi:hypothetical protein
MDPVMIETTVPASADCGVRSFRVLWEGLSGEAETAVEVQVCGLESRNLTGEAVELLEIKERVPTNQEVGRALVNLGVALLNKVGAVLCNPDD